MNRIDLQELSKIRLKEAHALLRLGLSDGAYYLAGYSVECAIKAVIAKKTNRGDFPDKKRVDSSYTHSLKDLIRVAELEYAHAAKIAEDPLFKKYWDVAQAWSEQSRYQRPGPASAKLLVSAVGDRRHGIISWLKLHW